MSVVVAAAVLVLVMLVAFRVIFICFIRILVQQLAPHRPFDLPQAEAAGSAADSAAVLATRQSQVTRRRGESVKEKKTEDASKEEGDVFTSDPSPYCDDKLFPYYFKHM